MRIRNLRTGKESSVTVFKWPQLDLSSDAVGCFNPFEYTTNDDFRINDKLQLKDFMQMTQDPKISNQIPLLPVSCRIEDGTGTGWNIKADGIKFGNVGIVGDWFKTLSVIFLFEKEIELASIMTDACTLPCSISVRSNDKDIWNNLVDNGRGPWINIRNSKRALQIRVRWESTDLHQTDSLCSYRAGGGFHVQYSTESSRIFVYQTARLAHEREQRWV